MPFRYRGNRWIGVHIGSPVIRCRRSGKAISSVENGVWTCGVGKAENANKKSRAIPAGGSFRRLFAVVAAVAGSFAAVFAALAVVTALAIFTLAIRVVAFSHLVSPVKFIDNLNIMRKRRFVNRVKRGIL